MPESVWVIEHREGGNRTVLQGQMISRAEKYTRIKSAREGSATRQSNTY